MKEEVLKLLKEGKNSEEIADIFGISVRNLQDTLKKEGTKLSILSKDVKDENILYFYNLGYTNEEISKLANTSRAYISKFLKERDLSSNTKISKANDKTLKKNIENLVIKGLSNSEIAKELHISPTTARKYTNELGLETNSIKKKPICNNILVLREDQEDLIYGSLLGDLYIESKGNYSRVCIHHGGDQELYFDHKCEVLSNIIGKANKNPRYDKRLKKYLPCFSAKTLSHSIFNSIRELVYPQGIKTISLEWLNRINARGLAYWFMDDGTYSGSIGTLDFSYEEHLLLQEWLLNTYGIKTTIQKQKGYTGEESNKIIKGTKEFYFHLYLKEETRKVFDDLIRPYIHPSMLYKLKYK